MSDVVHVGCLIFLLYKAGSLLDAEHLDTLQKFRKSVFVYKLNSF